MSGAASKAREVIAALSPQAAETHRISVLLVELLAVTVEQNERLIGLLEQGAGGTTVNGNTSRAGASQGPGPAVVPAPALVPAPGGATADDEQAGDDNVRLLEPDVGPETGDAGGRPTPAKKAPAKKAARAKKATASREAGDDGED
jgi:hypothetical protein